MARFFFHKQLAPKAAAPAAGYLAIIAAVALWSAPAQAHKVTVFAWVQDNMVHTESKFSGGRRVRNGKITVLNERGDTLLTGTTDDRGRFSFPVPGPDGLDIVLRAGAGHGNHWRISPEEIADALGSPTEAEDAQTSMPETLPRGKAIIGRPDVNTDPPITRGDLERIMARQLAPIKAQLARINSDRPAWRDIAGGIGYLIGLMGLASYYRNRQKKD